MAQSMKKLAERYIMRFPEVLRAKNGQRLIGREAEFPVVTPCGGVGDVQVCPMRFVCAVPLC
jgi:hypothetical protein